MTHFCHSFLHPLIHSFAHVLIQISVKHYLRTGHTKRDETSPPSGRSACPLYCQEPILPTPTPPPHCSAFCLGNWSCWETAQLPETLNPHHPVQGSESRPRFGTWTQETSVRYSFFFRYRKVNTWAVVGQGSICNMPKGYSDLSRGSIATNWG